MTVDSLMLQCRRSEKDFLMRGDLKYRERLQETIGQLIEDAQAAAEGIAKKAGLTEAQQKLDAIPCGFGVDGARNNQHQHGGRRASGTFRASSGIGGTFHGA